MNKEEHDDFNEIWNDFCYHVDRNIGNLELGVFHNTVEFLFEKLGWSMRKGDLISKLIIPIGSGKKEEPDIILMNNKKPVVVIEVKQAGASLSDKNMTQLYLYMQQLELDFGILIGESLQFYYYSPKNSDNEKFFDTQFKNDSQPGIECMNALFKKDFSFNKLKAFRKVCLEFRDFYVDESSSRRRDSKELLPGVEKKSRPKKLFLKYHQSLVKLVK
ncbi:MAG: type I restriction enzyme HsdR N-terminal domain-containing protein [Oscillospiraceae bacterium]|jgi:hypothetical protein|nr:type I restriction enzyme HsdR N-terminal domain-containing protein [Oscillospiraceae bacterium]